MDEPDQLQQSLDDLYKTGFRAGYEAGLRRAIEIIRREHKELTDPVFLGNRHHRGD